ncbi:molybdopterin-binding/glycosyltransferase family 2 protein [Pseudovibrio sp. SPO723]|uniref:molybdopterin-binding/glycosyltransferase family 2 protein n=1 Tax=Nesiotobacter zosterae TaxID=392721 RepID=UPI0029C1498F|nr:molybdopterin-binding/glycosyltransferase family 2 protein [Pseudovibrio sp. SPO723]MDX5592108.1 molybdopterin-binding/glycosyltransferase family 2 protein [Pseudovibrio sp. SPO723]
MYFGELPTSQATGCYLAHSLKAAGLHLKKGHRLSEGEVATLEAAGVASLTVARLDAGDIHEDEAAQRFAASAAGAGTIVAPPFTGRVNLYAEHAGIIQLDEDAILSANMIDPAITMATLEPFAPVEKGRMLATAKIIPLAAEERHLGAAAAAIQGAIRVAPYTAKRVAVVSTTLPHLKDQVIGKTLAALQDRLRPSESVISAHLEVPHTYPDLKEALGTLDPAGFDLLIIFGASAVVDVNDIIPSALRSAGGNIEHFGMPVDPGNLLVLGSFAGKPAIGAPGCARSPQENGFDWVLNRLLADFPITAGQIKAMGVGGLLKEIYSRPQPREEEVDEAHRKRQSAAIILAAGQSRRTGDHNKLLARVHGVPIIRQVALSAIESKVDRVHVVVGKEGDAIQKALQGLPVQVVHNERAEAGLSTSVAAGINSLPDSIEIAVMLLGDMPEIAATHVNELLAGYEPNAGKLIGVATCEGKRGNPVLWDRRFFSPLTRLHGDIGGKPVMEENAEAIYTIELGRTARLDLDDPTALDHFGAKMGSFSLKSDA